VKLSNLIDKELLITRLSSKDTNDVLEKLTLILKDKKRISESEPILAKLLEREKLASTSIGKNTAIPHAKIKDLKNPIIMIAVCREGFLYNPNDSEPVHLIILVLSPSGAPALHLQILAAAASLIKRPGDLIGELLKAENSDELANTIKKFEESND
jgi:mannitol/fructose-specific phosphotransferase system IIA component (Ntr-type)